MIVIKCDELTTDEQLALAESITSEMDGRALALARGTDIVLDQIGNDPPSLDAVEKIVGEFISKRRDGADYSFEVEGEVIAVHSADPIRAMRERRKPSLPNNLFKCPFCGFVTPYEEAYVVHYRAQGFT